MIVRAVQTFKQLVLHVADNWLPAEKLQAWEMMEQPDISGNKLNKQNSLTCSGGKQLGFIISFGVSWDIKVGVIKILSSKFYSTRVNTSQEETGAANWWLHVVSAGLAPKLVN